MNISLSNMMVTNIWTAFLSVLAIIGIIVAGGFIVAMFGRMILTIFNAGNSADDNVRVDEFGYVSSSNNGSTYQTQEQEVQQHANVAQATTAPSEDYSYALDVDDNLAKEEEDALNNELTKVDEDDFFNDFNGEDDLRFGDDDLMGMVDEISQDILDEEEQSNIQTEQEESIANQSVLDKYSIDTYLDEDIEDDEDIIEDEFEDKEMSALVDEDTMNEINALKQQVKEIVESMEENKNQSETFNEQLINILNELKEANKREVKTEEDAEREINDLKQQLENSRIEMEEQLQARIADKDAEYQARLQEQLDASNAEIENLKAQLSALIEKMEEPDDEAQEVEPEFEEELSEIDALRNEVKDMLDAMREETNAKNDEANAQILEILNEMKQASLKQSEQAKIETAEDAIEEIDDLNEELELNEKELEKQFKEEMLHKDDAEKAELRAQMENYSEEIGELKAQLAQLMDKFKEESENAKAENQALIDQLEAERQERIHLQQSKLETEKEQQAQLERLRKENEELADKLQARVQMEYEPLTQDEMDDLYSETTNIDYSAISQMNEEQIDERVKAGLEDSKQEIEELKQQVSRLTAYMQERENSMAEKINVHEVRTVDFDIEQLKEEAAKEVEERVQEKLIDSLAEISLLKDELIQTKLELENQYKEQLSNTKTGMEYEEVSKLQTSAEKIDELDAQLSELSQAIKEEQKNIKDTSEQCIAELEALREVKAEEVKENGIDEVSVIGPKNNKVALVYDSTAEAIEAIDAETVKKLTDAEIDEIIEARLEDSSKEIEQLKNQIDELKQDLIQKTEEIEKSTTVPAVRSPLFDVEAIKKITAQEVEIKVQERLAEAMKEIEEMKRQLELSKQEIEKQYKEQVINNASAEEDVKAQLKGSAAEVIELKEQLTDLTEQIALEHQEAQQNSEVIAEQLEQDRKEKEEIAKLQLSCENSELSVVATEVTVIGPKDNQVALVTGNAFISEEIEDDIPTIDIETVKKLTEQEIEEKVNIRMASSTVEIEELKKQILNLSIQIQEIKGKPTDDNDEGKPMVFHYATEEAYLERLAILEERLKNAKKDLKINNKELSPLEKVNRTLERDKIKLRRKYAIAAKKKVALYGVNNYVDIDKEKAEKLAQELELLEGLKLSVSHCEEVMNANIDRYPILVHTDKILRENIANIESDIATLNKELTALREKNGAGDINE